MCLKQDVLEMEKKVEVDCVFAYRMKIVDVCQRLHQIAAKRNAVCLQNVRGVQEGNMALSGTPASPAPDPCSARMTDLGRSLQIETSSAGGVARIWQETASVSFSKHSVTSYSGSCPALATRQSPEAYASVQSKP